MNKRDLWLLAGGVVIILLVTFAYTQSMLLSPEEQIIFSNGDSYTLSEIDEAFSISDEETLNILERSASESAGEDELISEVIGTGCEIISDDFQTSPQTFDDSCYWDAIFDAKEKQFSIKITKEWRKSFLINEVSAKFNLFRSTIGGSAIKGTPIYSSLNSEQKLRFNEILNYLDNKIIESNRPMIVVNPPWSADTNHEIGIGWFSKENKALIYNIINKSKGSIVISWKCPGGLLGHAQRVIEITPNPSCISTKMKLGNPEGEIEINSDGEIITSTNSALHRCPPPSGGGPAPNPRIHSMTIIFTVPNRPVTPLPPAFSA